MNCLLKKKRSVLGKGGFIIWSLNMKNEIIIQQRTGKDIWNQLFEFPMMEKEKETPIDAILKEVEKSGLLSKRKYEMVAISPLFKQQLSHQLIAGQFIKIKVKEKNIIKIEMLWIKVNQLKKFAFPKFINQYFDNSKDQTLF